MDYLIRLVLAVVGVATLGAGAWFIRAGSFDWPSIKARVRAGVARGHRNDDSPSRAPRAWWRVLPAALIVALLIGFLLTDTPASLDLWSKAQQRDWQLWNVWAAHTIWAGFITQALTVGVVYLLWERRRHQAELIATDRQKRRAMNLSATGMAGIVDHLIDVELCLALAAYDDEDAARVAFWQIAEADKLDNGWPALPDDRQQLRIYRDALAHVPAPRHTDVRLSAPDPRGLWEGRWRTVLVDLAVRRIASGIVKWGPLIDRSDAGAEFAMNIAQLRSDLMTLQRDMGGGPPPGPDSKDSLTRLRTRARTYAYFFEIASSLDGTDDFTRPEVLLTRAGLPAEKTPALPQTLKADAYCAASARSDCDQHAIHPADGDNVPQQWTDHWEKAYGKIVVGPASREEPLQKPV